MATTAELNTQNYRVDDATMDQFQNITTFVKNMTVKDSKYYEETETYYSKWLGNLLLKYVDIGLTEAEAADLYEFVNSYNNSVETLFDENSNENKSIKNSINQFQINMLQLLGLYKDQDYENSLLNILVLYYLKYEKNLNNYKNEISAYFFRELFINEETGVLKYDSENQPDLEQFLSYTNLNKTIQNLLLNTKTELLNNQEVSIIIGSGSHFNYNSNKSDDSNYLILDNNEDVYYYDNSYYYLPEFAYDEDKFNVSAGNDAAASNCLYLTEEYFYFNAENYLLNKNEFEKLDDSLKNLFIRKKYDISGKQSGQKDIEDWPIITESDNTKSTNLQGYLFNAERLQNFKITKDGRYYLNGSANVLEVNTGFLIYNDTEKSIITHIVFNSSFGCFVIDVNKIITSSDASENSKKYGVYNKEVFIGGYSYNFIINKKQINFTSTNNTTYFENSDNNLFSSDIYLDNHYTGAKDTKPQELPEDKKERFYLLKTSNGADWVKFTNYGTDETKSTVLDTFRSKKFDDVKMNSIIDIFKSKEKILMKEKEDNTENPIMKLKATEEEKSLLIYGCPLAYFDLKISVDGKNTSLLILFKELNPRYRDILKSNEVEIFMNSNFSSSTYFNYSVENLINRDEGSLTLVTYNMVNFLRSISSTDNDILIQDFEIIENGKIEYLTTQAFKYLYGNSYTARSANESDIIAYYIDDPYKHNRYGRYKYEKEEIYSFISTYQETRNYYYRVLLNESFINEEEYKLYEKTFLSFWAIERFLSSKIDNVKDINTFNLTDVKNFLTSYGMGDLSELLNLNDFYNSEDLSKRLIKNYIPLVQNKGSREVIDVLQDTFSIDQGSLEIYKTLLLKNNMGYKKIEVPDDTPAILSELTIIEYKGEEYKWKDSSFVSKEDETTPFPEAASESNLLKVKYNEEDYFWDGKDLRKIIEKDSYIDIEQTEFKFIKTEYNSDNLYYEIINNMNSAKSYENFTENDNYWDKNTSTDYLKDLNIYHETTKYLMSEFKSEIAYNYFVVRIVFIVIDYLIETLLVDNKIDNNILSDTEPEKITYEGTDGWSWNKDTNELEKSGETSIVLTDGTNISYLGSSYKWSEEKENFITESGPDYSFIFDSAINSVLDIEISNSDIFEGNINLYTYLILLRETFVRYLNTLVDTDFERSSKRTFKINKAALQNTNYTKYLLVNENYIWSINDNEIEKDFMSTFSTEKTGANPQVELVKNIMRSLLPLFAIEDDRQRGSKVLNLGALNIGLYSESRLSLSNISSIIYGLMDFLIKMLIGHDGVPLSDLTWLDFNTYSFINKLFNDIFIVEDKENSSLVETLMGENFNFDGIYEDDNSEYYKEMTLKPGPLISGVTLTEDLVKKADSSQSNFVEGFDLQEELYNILLNSKLPSDYDTIEKYDEFIIAGCKELSSILGTVFSIPLKESENNLLKYLQQAIEYFISYTSQLKEISYVKEYKTRYETVHIGDNFKAMKSTMDIDSIYLDESLKISLEDKLI